jgi:[ribosomal protein S5]-alanine N-acetyltransferase
VGSRNATTRQDTRSSLNSGPYRESALVLKIRLAYGLGVILPHARSVTLRLFTPEDAHAVFVLSQQPGMREWLPDQVYADEAGALATLDALIAGCAVADPRRAPLVLAVCTSELVGHVGLSAARGAVEIGYAIDDSHRGKGLATDAVRAMADWGLRTFALPYIDGIVAADNVASCRVLERAGFDLVQETARPLHGKLRLVREYRFQRQPTSSPTA